MQGGSARGIFLSGGVSTGRLRSKSVFDFGRSVTLGGNGCAVVFFAGPGVLKGSVKVLAAAGNGGSINGTLVGRQGAGTRVSASVVMGCDVGKS